jgi:outer membrane protein TolC
MLTACATQQEKDAWTALNSEANHPDGVAIPGRSSTGLAPTEGGDESLPANPRLQDYLYYAAVNNPGLRVSFHRWKAALEEVPQARALPDPTFTYGYYLREVETRVGPMRQQFGLKQKLPWPSKLTTRAEAALRQAEVQEHLYDEAKFNLFYNVKLAYYEYYYLARSIAIVKENLALLENMEAAVLARYKAGAADQPAVIQIQVELGRLEDRLKSLEALRPAHVARLNAAIGRNPGRGPSRNLSRNHSSDTRRNSGVDPDPLLPWPEHEPRETPPLELADLTAVLEQENPELAAARQQILAAEADRDAAETLYWPDFGVGAGYIQIDPRSGANVDDNGQDAALLTLEVSLPIWYNRYNAAVREAEARHAAAARMRDDLENRLAADLNTALYHYEDAGRKVNLFRDTLVPKAEQSYATATSAFSSGKASFLDMMETERTLLELRLLAVRARVNQNIRLAELEKLCGRGLREEIPAGAETSNNRDSTSGR